MKDKKEEYKVGDKFYYQSIEGLEVAEIKSADNELFYFTITYPHGYKSNTKFSVNHRFFSRFKKNRLTPLIKELL